MSTSLPPRATLLLLALVASLLLLRLGAVPLLVFAGLIEGFLSPAETVPWWVKWGVGLLSGGILYSYLLLGGRKKQY